jgi:hypothetical protein
VDDPYSNRLIAMSSSYNSNPYILAASLADVNRWPELAMPSSPQLSETEAERSSGFPGASDLKYTQTIMGSKSGGMGLRVSGRRSSLKRVSGTPRQEDVKNFLTDNSLNHDTTISQDQNNSNVAEASAKVVQFIPRFKGAAEMEARRRIRMLARKGPVSADLPSQQVPSSNPEPSSSSSSEMMVDETEDDFEGMASGNDSDDDEFDPLVHSYYSD